MKQEMIEMEGVVIAAYATATIVFVTSRGT